MFKGEGSLVRKARKVCESYLRAVLDVLLKIKLSTIFETKLSKLDDEQKCL